MLPTVADRTNIKHCQSLLIVVVESWLWGKPQVLKITRLLIIVRLGQVLLLQQQQGSLCAGSSSSSFLSWSTPIGTEQKRTSISSSSFLAQAHAAAAAGRAQVPIEQASYKVFSYRWLRSFSAVVYWRNLEQSDIKTVSAQKNPKLGFSTVLKTDKFHAVCLA